MVVMHQHTPGAVINFYVIHARSVLQILLQLMKIVPLFFGTFMRVRPGL